MDKFIFHKVSVVFFALILLILPAARSEAAEKTTSSTLQALSDDYTFLAWTEISLGLADIPTTPIKRIASYANLSLRQCIEIAIAGNFDIQSSRRDLLIRSSR